MTGLLLFLGVIVLLAVALEVIHRRVGAAWRPGLDTRRDRDLARLEEDLRSAAQREPESLAPTALSHLSERQAAREAWSYHKLAA